MLLASRRTYRLPSFLPRSCSLFSVSALYGIGGEGSKGRYTPSEATHNLVGARTLHKQQRLEVE